MIYECANVALDTDRYELRLRGEQVAVEPRVLDLLFYLAKNSQRLISKDELLSKVWDDQHVSESALTRAIHQARQALGEEGRMDRHGPR